VRGKGGIILLVLLLVATPVCPALSQDTTTTRATQRSVLIDFQDADLRAVITALAEAGGLNVTYGELTPRRITLRLRQPISPSDVLPLLRSIAQSNGLRVIEEDGHLFRADASRTARFERDGRSEPRLLYLPAACKRGG
jgi:type II secretory pathway component GspD/PulD (secretin)